jgi:predicted amidohydrolase YtcJ
MSHLLLIATGAPSILLAACVSAGRTAPAAADIVFRGGTVYTADSLHPRASAAAVRGARIVYVGDEAGAERWTGRDTRVIEMHGGMLLPGFHDAHVHPLTGGVELAECNVVDDTTRAELLAHIARCGREQKGAWVRGSGWQLPLFAAANPQRALLDSLVPDRPAYFTSMDGHSAWVNSRALALAGITAATSDPPNGRIERDRSGAPTGTLRESASSLVSRQLPRYGQSELEDGARRGLALASSFGITSVQEASADSAMLAAYASLARQNQLPLRVVAAIRVDPSAGVAQVPAMAALRARFATERLRPTAAKIFVDGVIEAHTAALLEPYVDTHDRGPANLTPPRLDSIVIALDRAGFQVHMHAIGDRAVRMGLDAVAAARAANGTRDSRHHIAHLQMIDTADVPRFHELGVYANFQALWAYRDTYIQDLTEPVLGAERSSRLYPIGSVARTGATIVGGSDWSVSSMNPLEAIQVGVTRRAPDAPAGEPWLPKEAVTLEQMLAAYTINGARVSFEERETGSIEVGKAADLVVLDRDLFAIPANEIHRARVLRTFVDGREIYTAPPSATP